MACFRGGDQGHTVVKCPGLEQPRGFRNAAASRTPPTTTQSQQWDRREKKEVSLFCGEVPCRFPQKYNLGLERGS
jgi:hypothetical protein